MESYNRVFRRMMDLSDNVEVQGEKLLDIFDVDENYSTTIAALQTKQTVRGGTISINPRPERSCKRSTRRFL